MRVEHITQHKDIFVESPQVKHGETKHGRMDVILKFQRRKKKALKSRPYKNQVLQAAIVYMCRPATVQVNQLCERIIIK